MSDKRMSGGDIAGGLAGTGGVEWFVAAVVAVNLADEINQGANLRFDRGRGRGGGLDDLFGAAGKVGDGREAVAMAGPFELVDGLSQSAEVAGPELAGQLA